MDLGCFEDRVAVSGQSIFKPAIGQHFASGNESVRDAQTAKRDGFFVRVDEEGTFGTHVFLKDGQVIDLKEVELSDVDVLKTKMMDCLKQAGLNDQEAKALLKCWTPAFFEQPGQRVVFLLHRSEYDLMCPMKLRPEPTELARVGLVLTELED